MSIGTVQHCYSPAVYSCLLPRVRVGTGEWCAAHLRMPDESKIRGNFRRDLFPHMDAIFDALDDPEIDVVTLQTAAQVGKTTLCQAYCGKVAATDPHPMAWLDADERACRRVINRTWKLFERCTELAPLCPPVTKRSAERMELRTCILRGAWPRSSSSTADFPAFVVVINEADKCQAASTSEEADPRYLIRERTKGYVGAKILQVSTPTLLGTSFIESQRLAGDNRRRLVPCPHCGVFQELRTGNGRDPGGLKGLKHRGTEGTEKLDAAYARENAYYECEACRGQIREHQRQEMLQAGVWCPEGCTVDKRGRVRGNPLRPGRHASFGPITTLHSLLPGITIGVYAEEYVNVLTATQRIRERRQHWTNSWEGKTWDPKPKAVRPSELVERLGVEEPLRVVPAWGRFLTLGADVSGIADDLLFHWQVVAWGLHGRSQLVDLGVAWTREEMRRLISGFAYPVAGTDRNGCATLRPVTGGIDSGSFTETVYEFCRPLPGIWPVKGSSRNEAGTASPWVAAGFVEMYQPAMQRTGLPPELVTARQKAGAYDLIMPNTQRSQDWLEERLQGLVKRDAANALTIPVEAFGQVVPGVDLAKHLLGDYQDEYGRWQKRYDEQHFRDAFRYAQVLAWHHTKNGSLWPTLTGVGERSPGSQKSEAGPSGFIRKRSGTRRKFGRRRRREE